MQLAQCGSALFWVCVCVCVCVVCISPLPCLLFDTPNLVQCLVECQSYTQSRIIVDFIMGYDFGLEWKIYIIKEPTLEEVLMVNQQYWKIKNKRSYQHELKSCACLCGFLPFWMLCWFQAVKFSLLEGYEMLQVQKGALLSCWTCATHLNVVMMTAKLYSFGYIDWTLVCPISAKK